MAVQGYWTKRSTIRAKEHTRIVDDQHREESAEKSEGESTRVYKEQELDNSPPSSENVFHLLRIFRNIKTRHRVCRFLRLGWSP
jgi:hypothetical protein